MADGILPLLSILTSLYAAAALHICGPDRNSDLARSMSSHAAFLAPMGPALLAESVRGQPRPRCAGVPLRVHGKAKAVLPDRYAGESVEILPRLPGQDPGWVRTVTIEADTNLPDVLMSPGWLEQVAKIVAADNPISPKKAVAFDSLARMLDSVLLIDAQLEKASLQSRWMRFQEHEGKSVEDMRRFVDDLRKPLEDAGFRLASKRDLALSSALQQASQRVLRSEVEVDESHLVDLFTQTRPSVASSRVLIFCKGPDVQERGGYLFFEKMDYLQGEVLSSILGFWKQLARSAWGKVTRVNDAANEAVKGVQADASGALDAVRDYYKDAIMLSGGAMNATASRIGSSTRQRSGGGGGTRGGGRIRSARIGSMQVATPDELLRQSNTRVKVVRRSGRRRARRLVDKLLRRWGLISTRTHELRQFLPGGTWSLDTGSALAELRLIDMKTAFALAIRDAKQSSVRQPRAQRDAQERGHPQTQPQQQSRQQDVAELTYWRAILSALLRPVYLQDPIFTTTVVLYARSSDPSGPASPPPHTRTPPSSSSGDWGDLEEDKDVWTRIIIACLRSIDPGLPTVWGFHGQRQRRSSVQQQGQKAQQGDEHAVSAKGSLAGVPEGYVTLSMLSYNGVKVENLRALFPDRYLKFRPLDSFKLDLVTLVTFISIAVTRLRFDADALSDILALSAFTVWSIGVYYRIVARKNEYELETTRRLAGRLSARGDNVVRLALDAAVDTRQKRCRLVYASLVLHGPGQVSAIVARCLDCLSVLTCISLEGRGLDKSPTRQASSTAAAQGVQGARPSRTFFFDDGACANTHKVSNIVENALHDLLRLGLVQETDNTWTAVELDQAAEHLTFFHLGTRLQQRNSSDGCFL